MRTTLTIDPDVAAELKRLRRKHDSSFKALINQLLRLGLRELSTQSRAPMAGEPFQTRVVSLGAPFIDLDNVAETLAIAEGEDHG